MGNRPGGANHAGEIEVRTMHAPRYPWRSAPVALRPRADRHTVASWPRR